MKIPYNVDLTPEQNKNIAIEAVTANGSDFIYVDKRYRDDEQVVRAALAHNGPFDKVSDRLKRDQNIALIAVQNNPYAFKHHVIALSENLGYEDVETFLTELEGQNKDNLLAVQLAAIEAGRIGVRQACIVKTQGDYMVDVDGMQRQSYYSRVAKIAFNQDLGNQRSGIFNEETKKLVSHSYSYDRRFGGALLQLCVDGVVNYVHYNQALDNGRIPLGVDNFGAGVAEVGTCNDPRNPSHLTVALNNNAALIYKFIPEDEQGKIGRVKPFYSNNGIEIEITPDQSRAFLSEIVDNEPGHIFDQVRIREILTTQQLIVNNPEQQMRVDEPQIRKQVKIEVDDKIIDKSQNQIEKPGTRVESPNAGQMIDKSQNKNQGQGH